MNLLIDSDRQFFKIMRCNYSMKYHNFMKHCASSCSNALCMNPGNGETDENNIAMLDILQKRFTNLQKTYILTSTINGIKQQSLFFDWLSEFLLLILTKQIILNMVLSDLLVFKILSNQNWMILLRIHVWYMVNKQSSTLCCNNA